MSCACIKGIYDFRVEACDTNRLLYTDLSEWMKDEPYIIPKYHRIYVTPPGQKKEYEVLVEPLSTTVIDAGQIGMKKLQDGIYCFTVKPLDESSGGCGKEYIKSTGIFPNLECCIAQAHATLDDDKYEDIKDVEKMLTMSKVSVDLGKVKSAQDTFKIAKKLLDRLKCDCTC